MNLPDRWFPTPVAVEGYGGEGAYGPVWATSVTIPAQVDSGRKLVRNSAGDEVTSESTLLLPPAYWLAGAQVATLDTVVPESRVTVLGRAVQVVAVNPVTDMRGRLMYVEAVLD